MGQSHFRTMFTNKAFEIHCKINVLLQFYSDVSLICYVFKSFADILFYNVHFNKGWDRNFKVLFIL